MHLPLKLLILFILFTGSVHTYAQSISGAVKNRKGVALPFANVSLLRQDSSFIENALSDSLGYFIINHTLSKGKYILNVSRIGYLPYYAATNVINEENHVDITLSEKKNEISEVSVSSSKPLFERKTDRVIFNVENSIVASGENLIDILKLSPGVIVDGKENILVNGKSGISFMVDDKLLYMSGDQLTNYLKSIPSSNVRSIEIISNPSAKYDAAGTSGIINIVMKKKKNQGLNGDINVTAFQGIYAGYIAAFNLNYKKDNLNLYCSFNSNTWTFISNQTQTRQINTSSEPITFQQTAFLKNPDYTNDLKLGLDWELKEKQTLSVSLQGIKAEYPGASIDYTRAYRQSNPANADSSFISKDHTTEPLYVWEANTNYTREFDTSGQKLSIDYVYTHVDDHSVLDHNFSYYSATGAELRAPLRLNSNNPSTNSINALKIDYVLPVKSVGKIETGFKSSFISNDNDNIFSQGSGDVLIVDSSRSNHFLYKENINALYLNWNRETGDNTFQAGLRAEQSIIEGNSLTLAYSFKQNYINLFPSAGIQHSFNENNQLSFSYSRRISRPDYSQLNPFLYYLDAYAYQQGNPFLKPEIANVFELAYVLQGKYSVTYNFSSASDVIYDLSTQNDSTRLLFNTDINLGHSYNHALVFTLPMEPAKWWHIDGNYGLTYNIYTGTIQNTSIDRSAASFNINISNNFILPNGFSIQATGYYRAPSIRGIENFSDYYNISLGIKKQVLNGKGNLKFIVTDIFYTQRDFVTVDFDNQHRTSNQTYDSRKARLTFTYNFARGIEFSRKERESSDDDERSRIKQK